MDNDYTVVSPSIIDEKAIPQALLIAIDAADKQLIQAQQQLLDQINSMALELMEMLNLSPDEGWALDLGQKKFIRLGESPLDNEE